MYIACVHLLCLGFVPLTGWRQTLRSYEVAILLKWRSTHSTSRHVRMLASLRCSASPSSLNVSSMYNTTLYCDVQCPFQHGVPPPLPSPHAFTTTLPLMWEGKYVCYCLRACIKDMCLLHVHIHCCCHYFVAIFSIVNSCIIILREHRDGQFLKTQQ